MTCAGTAPDGSPIDTSTFGAHSFTVTGTDYGGRCGQLTLTLDDGQQLIVLFKFTPDR